MSSKLNQQHKSQILAFALELAEYSAPHKSGDVSKSPALLIKNIYNQIKDLVEEEDIAPDMVYNTWRALKIAQVS